MANNNLGRDKVWNTDIWADIDKAVTAEVLRLRVVQKLLPSSQDGNGQYVPADVFDNATMTIAEGQTKPYLEISVEFKLTQGQADDESTLHTGKTLARLAAKAVAQAEDALFLQGKNPAPALPATTKVVNRDWAGAGLLGATGAPPPAPPAGGAPEVELIMDPAGANALAIAVRAPAGAPPDDYGTNTFQAVTKGISELTRRGQPGPYALILSSDVYASTYAPLPGTLVTTADRLTPLLAGGYYGTGTLPPKNGLLVSLGGDPTTIYIGQDATTAYTQADADGNQCFRVFERVQLVVRDPQALLPLQFQ